MRTLISDMLAKLWGREKNDGRNYCVGAHISFVFTSARMGNLTTDLLRSRILEADSKFPWVDGDPKLFNQESIGYLSEGEIVVHESFTLNGRCCFNFEPPDSSVRKGQVHAYEKYVEKLGREILKEIDRDLIKEINVGIFMTSQIRLK